MYTLAQYFDHSRLVGLDVSRAAIRKAKNHTKYIQTRKNRLTFTTGYSRAQTFAPYDCILAMSSLCFYDGIPDSIHDVITNYPFDKFVASIREVDSLLRPGGLFAVFNSSYAFEETEIFKGYTPITLDKLPTRHLVTKLLPSGQAYPSQDSFGCIFRKNCP